MSIFKRKKNDENTAETVKEEANAGLTLGARISAGRKRLGYTQEEFSEKLGVTPQAVSKWENDASCPDIQLLPEIAKIFGISVDELLTGKAANTDNPVKAEKPVDTSKLKFCINITKPNQKPFVMSLPFAAAKNFTRIGNSISGIMGNGSISSSQLEEILQLVENGATGEVFKLEAEDNTVIRFVIE